MRIMKAGSLAIWMQSSNTKKVNCGGIGLFEFGARAWKGMRKMIHDYDYDKMI